ncbi:MAG: hypothetical protein R2764_01880 [Bacteroidales bacterium]
MDGQVDNSDKNEVWSLNNGLVGDGFMLIWEDDFDLDGTLDEDK